MVGQKHSYKFHDCIGTTTTAPTTTATTITTTAIAVTTTTTTITTTENNIGFRNPQKFIMVNTGFRIIVLTKLVYFILPDE